MSTEMEENFKKLQQCKRHKFRGPQGMNIPLTCENCGGRMSLHDIQLYRAGYAAAGGNPNDILVLDEVGES